jgi:hypothetical protein
MQIQRDMQQAINEANAAGAGVTAVLDALLIPMADIKGPGCHSGAGVAATPARSHGIYRQRA